MHFIIGLMRKKQQQYLLFCFFLSKICGVTMMMMLMGLKRMMIHSVVILSAMTAVEVQGQQYDDLDLSAPFAILVSLLKKNKRKKKQVVLFVQLGGGEGFFVFADRLYYFS